MDFVSFDLPLKAAGNDAAVLGHSERGKEWLEKVLKKLFTQRTYKMRIKLRVEHVLLHLIYLYQVNAYIKEQKSIQVIDPNLGPINRNYAIFYPEKIAKSPGLILYFHGQNEFYLDKADETNYKNYVDDLNFILIYPAGMSDNYEQEAPDKFASWNIGDTRNTCTSTPTNLDWCYDSCKILNDCHECSWHTCYDDVTFIKNLVKFIKFEDEKFKDIDFDLKKFIVTGESNGGMMTYFLSGKLDFDDFDMKPSHFIPIYGNSPVNIPIKTDGMSNLLSLYDRFDHMVPMNGGESSDTYLWQSEQDMINYWIQNSQCKIDTKTGLEPFSTPWGTDDRNLSCQTYKSCDPKNGQNFISSCHYDGDHGDKPEFYVEECLWWVYNFTAAEVANNSASIIIQLEIRILAFLTLLTPLGFVIL